MNCFERIIIRLASNQTLDKMKNTILFFAIVFGSSLLAQDRSIEFQDITFDEALKASRTENKPIFMDCYAVWCGPCKWMSANIFTKNDFDLYYLDLLNNREVSNEVGYTFQVIHESPQILVIRNGVVVAHASHSGINSIDLNTFV